MQRISDARSRMRRKHEHQTVDDTVIYKCDMYMIVFWEHCTNGVNKVFDESCGIVSLHFALVSNTKQFTRNLVMLHFSFFICHSLSRSLSSHICIHLIYKNIHTYIFTRVHVSSCSISMIAGGRLVIFSITSLSFHDTSQEEQCVRVRNADVLMYSNTNLFIKLLLNLDGILHKAYNHDKVKLATLNPLQFCVL